MIFFLVSRCCFDENKISIMKLLVLKLSLIFILDAKAFGPAKIPDDSDWKKDTVIDGFTIFTRSEEGSSILGFKLSGVLQAPIEQVMEHLRDVESSSEWTPGLVKKTTIEDISDIEAITYSVSDLPWPLKRRDYILHNKLFIHEKNKLLYVISYSIEDSRKPIDEDFVRADIGYSNIGLRPVSNKETYIEWTVFADPKGIIPSFIVNFYQKKFGVKFFHALEKRCVDKPTPLRPGLTKMLNKLREIIK
ncbi:MAG: hypothetical protein Fur0010_13950 [Bdellovibrio sp.]